MAGITIGVPGGGRDSVAAVDSLVKLEQDGLSAAWMTSGSGMDPIGLCTAAAVKTEKLLLGTAIAHSWPMAPVKMAQLAQLTAQLSGGRFRLGIGSASQPAVENSYGLPFGKPLGHLREYVQIIKALVETGEVDFQGSYYRAKHKLGWGGPVSMPVMIATLGPGSYALAGEVADGAISWVTPGTYIRDIAGPALQEAAAKAGRPAPPIVMHVGVAAHGNQDEVREQARKQFGFYPRAPHYQAMFVAAGFPEARDGTWSDRMIDSVVISGSEVEVEQRLRELVTWGASELLVSPLAGLGTDATTGLLARLAAG